MVRTCPDQSLEARAPLNKAHLTANIQFSYPRRFWTRLLIGMSKSAHLTSSGAESATQSGWMLHETPPPLKSSAVTIAAYGNCRSSH
jgi:hypothetical protein